MYFDNFQEYKGGMKKIFISLSLLFVTALGVSVVSCSSNNVPQTTNPSTPGGNTPPSNPGGGTTIEDEYNSSIR